MVGPRPPGKPCPRCPAVGPAIAQAPITSMQGTLLHRRSFLGCGRMRPRFALNGLNFFTAAVQAGFGPFIAVWLTQQGWSVTDSAWRCPSAPSPPCSASCPAACWSMHVHPKRFAAAGALVVIGLSAHRAVPVSPSLVRGLGRRGGARAGKLRHDPGDRGPDPVAVRPRWFRRAAGPQRPLCRPRQRRRRPRCWASSPPTISERSVFLVTATLVVPALVALFMIRGVRPGRGRPSGAEASEAARTLALADLHRTRAACFRRRRGPVPARQRGDAAAGAERPDAPRRCTRLSRLATIIVPQIITAVACALGRRPGAAHRPPAGADRGFCRRAGAGLLFAMLPEHCRLAVFQALDGISAAVFGLMLPLIAADLTRRTGYLNLAIGCVRAGRRARATVSTILAGWIAERVRHSDDVPVPGRRRHGRDRAALDRDAGNPPRQRHRSQADAEKATLPA